MKKTLLYTLLLIPAALFARTERLLTDWEFAHETMERVIPTENWQAVTVPHDWAIAGPFDRKNDLQEVAIVQNFENERGVKTGRTGGLPYVGSAWYQTHITIDNQTLTDSLTTLLFDGAMSEAEVYVNGKQAIRWPYGYASFHVDITQYLKEGDNLIRVRLQNRPESSRWYPGAGLYRNVHLITTPKEHITIWGVEVQTDTITPTGLAYVTIRANINNPDHKKLYATCNLYDQYNNAARIFSPLQKLNAKNNNKLQQTICVNNPRLWSPEYPNLYTARIELYDGKNRKIDELSLKVGIRKVEIVPNVGFKLNGEVRKFQGVCLHHDLGPLGAAVHKDAIRHQLKMLKDMGCDAIRTSHNMPAPDLVELCDEMGFMVMVEPFDEWEIAKCKNGYHRFFEKVANPFGMPDAQKRTWAELDMINMIHHYKNNPSVVMWSIGNEVPTQCSAEGYKVAKFLQDICKREDFEQRPVTCGMDQVSCVLQNGFAQILEVCGLNYRDYRYHEAYETTPQKLVLGSETASTVSSRGVYKLPAKKYDFKLYDDHQCSSYDLEYCPWSNLPDEDFALQEDYHWTIGQFVWTGFDYLGEPTPYDNDAWPSHSSNFGIIDLASIPKDRYYLYRSQWNKNFHTLHILPHWNWQEGDTVPVFVYTDYPEAELFLNGKSLGRQHKWSKEEVANDSVFGLQRRYRLIWDAVPYEAGELKVIAYNADNKPVMTAYKHTAGKPARLEAELDKVGELTYVYIRVIDNDLNLCPNADHLIQIELSGEGKLMGIANGDPACIEPLQGNKMHAFNGCLTAIVQGQADLKITAQGINGIAVQIR